MSNYNNDLVLEQLAEIESLRQQLAEKETQRQNLMGAYQRQGDSAQAVITDLRQQLAAKQADVDALMLEYCPNEMSQEQLYNWGSTPKILVPGRHAKGAGVFDPISAAERDRGCCAA